jgi:hypothetical protein
MGRTLKRVILPGEAMGWEAKLKLRSWVNNKDWDAGPRYVLVDTARASWDAMGRPEFADDPDLLVGSIYEYLLKDEEFKKRVVVDLKQHITEAEVWNEVAKAYAWVILQRYNRDLGEGDEDDD